MPKNNNKLRLYVWDDFMPDYTGGLAFAIATSETDAKKQIEIKWGYIDTTMPDHLWGACKSFPLTEPITFSVAGGS